MKLPTNFKIYVAVGVGLAVGVSLLTLVCLRASYEDVLIGGIAVTLAAATLVVMFQFPPVGIALLVVGGLLLPLRFETGTKTDINLAYVLAPVLIVLWLLRMTNHRCSPAWVSSRAVLPLILFVLFAILSTIVGQLPWFPAAGAPLTSQLGALGVFIFSGGVLLASAHYLRDLVWLRRITALFLLVGFVYVTLPLIPVADTLARPILQQAVRGSLFWTWLMSLCFAQASVNKRLHFGWRLASAAILLAAIYTTLFRHRDWASGWLPGLIAIAVILTLRMPILAGTLAVTGLTLGVWKLPTLAYTFWTAEQQYSFMTRLEAAKVLSQIITVNPLLGFGPANYYHYTPLYSIIGWYTHFSSHNNYIDVLAQTGILGLICLIWFLVELGRIALRLRHYVPEGFPKAYVYGALGGLAGTVCAAALADWFLPFVYNVGLNGFPSSIVSWVFLGGLIGLEQVFSKDHGSQRQRGNLFKSA